MSHEIPLSAASLPWWLSFKRFLKRNGYMVYEMYHKEDMRLWDSKGYLYVQQVYVL